MGILQNSIRDDGEQCCEEAYNRFLVYRKENHIYPFDIVPKSCNKNSSDNRYNNSLHREFCNYCGQLLTLGSECIIAYARIKDVLLCSECYCKMLIKPKED